MFPGVISLHHLPFLVVVGTATREGKKNGTCKVGMIYILIQGRYDDHTDDECNYLNNYIHLLLRLLFSSLPPPPQQQYIHTPRVAAVLLLLAVSRKFLDFWTLNSFFLFFVLFFFCFFLLFIYLLFPSLSPSVTSQSLVSTVYGLVPCILQLILEHRD